ncbi:MAG: Acetolactate synthase isozyme 1 large subunit [Syntrophorhabdus sp. PtaU1.Bin153]|nr:MAG: Acetolactate synthase isozyme 1 large subunit [Syntrophorhabdus sp. PtaU1.Bin153]
MKYNGAEIVVRGLEQQGITTVAGIPGGANLPIYNALYGSTIRHVLARHEQGAGFIAHGMARSTGKPAVCLTTSGPGVMNLLTAIADAKLDSVPLVAITGQVPTAIMGTDAFQEVDTYGMTMSITKHNFLVKNPKELLSVIPRAFYIAQSGRPGPVVIDIPKDIQLAEIDIDPWPHISSDIAEHPVDRPGIEQIARIINASHRPLIYAGGGVVSADGSASLHTLAKQNSIPVALTLMGLGTFPPDDPLYLGMLGMHGAPSTNFILDEADLLLAFGVRFDDRAIGKVNEFCPGATVIHVDIDQSEIDKIKPTHLSMVADIKTVMDSLIPLVEENQRTAWMDRVNTMKKEHPVAPPEPTDPFNPLHLMKILKEITRPETIVTTDVGQHQMWVAQAFPFDRPRTLLTSGGLGTMGFGLPAAIGAAIANPGTQVFCISGDGSFQMNIQELATLAELNLNVTILVMNNQHLGLVRQQQELFYQGNYIASRFSSRLDFAAIGRQFGIRGVNLEDVVDPRTVIGEMLQKKGPCIIDVPIHSAENVYPMVPPGAANREMIRQVCTA